MKKKRKTAVKLKKLKERNKTLHDLLRSRANATGRQGSSKRSDPDDSFFDYKDSRDSRSTKD